MSSPACSLVIACMVCGLTATCARAQECGPDQVAPWWPRAEFTDVSRSLTAAERAAVETQMTSVEALLRKTPYATPRGFAVRPSFSYAELADRTQLFSYEFALVTFARCSKYDEHGADIIISFNPDPIAWTADQGTPMTDEGGDRLYLEPIRAPALFGATATFGRFHEENAPSLSVLFTSGGRSPTLPVSREEYLRAMIFTLEGKNSEKVKANATLVAKTPYERWMEEAPARVRTREETYALMAKIDPAQAAKSRADMEKLERDETESLKRADAYERTQVSKNLAGLTALGDKYRAQIAAMSPQERASAAFLVGDDLVPAGTPNAEALVRKNRDFYRSAGSPLQPRAILVRMPAAYTEFRPQQQQLYKQLDWAAIKSMVN